MQITYRDNIPWIIEKYVHYHEGKRCVGFPVYAPFGEWYEANALICDTVYNTPMQDKSYRSYLPYEDNYILLIENGSFYDSSRIIIPNNESYYLKHQSIDTVYASDEWDKGLKINVNNHLNLSGNVLLINCSWAWTYYHFIASVLGRLLRYLEHFNDFSLIDHIVLPPVSNYMMECYQWLGLPKDKIIQLPSRHNYLENFVTAEKLIVPSLPIFPNRQTINYIREKSLLKPLKRNELIRKLYISRKVSAGETGRHIVNEENLFDKYLRPLGFEMIIPENLNFKEKARVYSEASHVIQSSGSGQANLIFMSPGSKVLEFVSRDFLSYHAIPITRQLSIDYYYNTNIIKNENNLFIEDRDFVCAVAEFLKK